MQMGFVQKLIAGLAAILTTVAMFTVVFFSSREAAHVEEALEDKAMVMATLASNAVAGGLEFDDKDATRSRNASDCISSAEGFDVAQRMNAPLPAYGPVTKGWMASYPK